MPDMLSRLTLAICACLLLFVPVFRAAEPLPPQIGDDELWKMVTSMSEPDGDFRFENFFSNELQYQFVIPTLKSTTRTGGVYMGVGPEQNFTYIAALQPKIAFITDIRRQNMIELMMYKAIFDLSADRADFLSMLFSRPRPAGLTAKSTAEQLFRAMDAAKPDAAQRDKNLKAIQDLLVQKHRFGLNSTDMSNIAYVYGVFYADGPSMDYSSGGRGTSPFRGMPNYSELMVADDAHGVNRSYLANEENYRYVRDMEMKNLIVPLVGDFAGPKSIRAIGQYLKDHGAAVTAFYLSNVEQYLYQDGKLLDFFKNVATLPMDSSSTFIRTFGGGAFTSTLSPMMETVKVCTANGGCDYSTVRNMSK